MFTVRQEGADTPLATCSIAEGRCNIITRSDSGDGSSGIGPEATPIGQVGEPTIRLDYDDQHVILTNISSEPQDVSRLHFVLDQPGLPSRSFLSVEWDDAGIVGQTSSLRSGGCLQLITSEADVITPDPQVCTTFMGWFRSNQAERYFWVADEPGVTFEVRIANEGTLLAICAIDAGVCEFNIP